MRGWILFQYALDPSLPEVPEIFRFQEAAAALEISLEVLAPGDFDLVVGEENEWTVRYQNEPIVRPDFIICRTGAETDYFTLALLRHFERHNIRLVNGPATIELVADKLLTLQNLTRSGLPVPRTILGKFPMDAQLVQQELGFPVIVKALKGTRGTGVLKCEDVAQFEDLAGLLETADARANFLFQHYIRASHGRDIRVLVVGGRVIAAMERRSSTGGFKSNVSLGGSSIAYNPPDEMIELAIRAVEALNLDVAGIDILFDKDGFRICEANSAPGFQGLERACGLDVPAIILEWVVSTQSILPASEPSDAMRGLAELVLGGSAGLKQLIDASTSYRHFARQIGWKLLLAGADAVMQGWLPRPFIDVQRRTHLALQMLFRGPAWINLATIENNRQERAFLVCLGVSIWTAALPWLVDGHAALSGLISLISLAYPMMLLFTAPAGHFGKMVPLNEKSRAK